MLTWPNGQGSVRGPAYPFGSILHSLTKMKPEKDGEEMYWSWTDALSKLSQVFITLNQRPYY